MALYNRIKVTITAGGTGNLTLGVPVGMFQGFGDAAVPVGTVVSYVIEDPVSSAWEYGRGTYTGPLAFSRTTVMATSAGSTAPINAGTASVLFVDALAEDFAAGLAVGTAIGGGTSGRILFDNGGALGEAANLTYDGTATSARQLKLTGSTSGAVTLQTQGAAGTYTLTLPNAAATANGQSLTSDTTGNLTWKTETPSDITFAATDRVLGRDTAGAGTGEELTASQVLDWVGATQGQVLYRSSAGWAALATGNAGQYLRTAGASANPAWADLPPYAVTPFSATATYSANDLVSYLGRIYRANTALTAGAWNATNWTEIGAAPATASIYPFDPATAYSAGDLVSNGGKIYSAPAAIAAGAFNAANWTEIGAAQTFAAGAVPFAGATGVLTQDATGLFWNATGRWLGLGAATAPPAGAFLSVASDIQVNGKTIGRGGGNINTNIAFGVNALKSNVTGSNNLAMGVNALVLNTGSQNLALGAQSMAANTSGTGNIGIGYYAISKNTIGGNNTGIGAQSLSSNVNGGSNTAIGGLALSGNVSGNSNIGIGQNAARGNKAGSNNIAIGSLTLDRGDSTANVAIGGSALKSSLGGNNVAIGDQAMSNTVNGTNCIAIGSHSLAQNYLPIAVTTLVAGTQYVITTVGTTDFTAIGAASSATGVIFTATGPGTGTGLAQQVVGGARNICIGTGAGNNIVSGSNNVILGGNIGEAGIVSNVILADGAGVEKARFNQAGSFILKGKTTAAIKALASPLKGAIEFSIDANTLCFFDGTAWQKVTTTAL